MPSHTLCALTRLSPCIARFVFGRRRLDVCTVLDGGNTQPLSTLSGQDSLTRALKTSCHLELKIRWLPSPLLTSRHLWDSNPRGETPSAQQANALAARPKCLLQESASQLHSSPGSHVTVSLCFLCPLTSPSHPLSPAHENNVHQPGIEPGSHQWQRCILPLDH